MTIYAESEKELDRILREAETDMIIEYNSVEDGFNSNYGFGSRAISVPHDIIWNSRISASRKGQHNRPMKKVKAIDNRGCFTVYPSIKEASIATSVP